MLRTEDEARKCWCPFVRLVAAGRDAKTITGAPAGYNRTSSALHHPDDTLSASFCIASACMAWREDWQFPPSTDADPYRTGKGYCGLAGKP